MYLLSANNYKKVMILRDRKKGEEREINQIKVIVPGNLATDDLQCFPSHMF
jgi:hypothetical protein